MNITKLKSGSYQIREMVNGRRYSVTVPYKPTKREATELINEKIDNTPLVNMPFSKAAQKYINSKSNILSPSTIREYTRTANNLPKYFKDMDICKIDDYELQKFVNTYSLDHSPKTVRNVYSFIRAVIRLFNPKANISATLPQKHHTEHYTPTIEDVKRILEYSKGSDYYIPLYLATLSLRCSEICALTIDDLNGDTISITKARVRGENGYVLKDWPKTDASYRTVVIPKHLSKTIRKKGYIFNYLPNQLDKYLSRVQKKLGIPHFGIHRLRHFFASYSHELGYSDAVIQSMGGWNTPEVMRSIYRHAMNENQSKKSIAKDFNF